MLVAVVVLACSASPLTPAKASFTGACTGAAAAPDAFTDAGLAADCLKAFGVSLGKTDGTFGENDHLLRSQVSSLLARFVQLAGVQLSGSMSFSDVNEATVPDSRVRDEISVLAGSGIIAGFPDGTFRPHDDLSVAQGLTLVIRSMHAIHAHNSNAPDIVDQGSTSQNATYAIHTGLLDRDAVDVHGTAYPNQPTDTTQRGLLADALAQAIQQLVNSGVLSPVTPPPASGDRATVDRPDQQAGYQIHAIYAIPSDGADHDYDTNGQVANAVSAMNSWLSTQTAGRALRIDTYQGAPDISFAQLPQTDAAYVATGLNIRDNVQQDLHTMGFNDVNKLYAVFWDGGSNDTCGGGAWPPELIGNVAAMYLDGTPPGAPACNTNPFGASSTTPGYLELAMLHEILHTLGFVATCAPHQHGAGHVNDGNHDLMWQGSEPWEPDTLDIGHDDYFNANIPGCPDLANSAFLTPLPAQAQTPPGWP